MPLGSCPMPPTTTLGGKRKLGNPTTVPSVEVQQVAATGTTAPEPIASPACCSEKVSVPLFTGNPEGPRSDPVTVPANEGMEKRRQRRRALSGFKSSNQHIVPFLITR